MGKVKIGSVKQKILVQGDINLLESNEILITHSEGYTILREKDCNRNIKTFIVVPLEEFVPKSKPIRTTKKKVKEVESTKPDDYGL